MAMRRAGSSCSASSKDRLAETSAPPRSTSTHLHRRAKLVRNALSSIKLRITRCGCWTTARTTKYSELRPRRKTTTGVVEMAVEPESKLRRAKLLPCSTDTYVHIEWNRCRLNFVGETRIVHSDRDTDVPRIETYLLITNRQSFAFVDTKSSVLLLTKSYEYPT